MKEEEFDIFDLDESRLDQEWLEQAKIFYAYARQLADARRDYEQSKAVRDLVEAEVDEDIRLNPEKYKMEKPTEKSIEKAVIRSTRYQEANKKVIISKHKQDTLQAVVDALEHRKKALEKRTDLWIHEWYAEPKAPKGHSDVSAEMKINAALGKHKRKSETRGKEYDY